MLEKTQVRIVAGNLRGRKITAVVHEGMRPTPQMVREALFSILGNAVPGRVFYDVFAGTGVVGLEAISRGATSARLIERDARQVAAASQVSRQATSALTSLALGLGGPGASQTATFGWLTVALARDVLS